MKLEFNDNKCVSFEGTYDEWNCVREELFPQWIDAASLPRFLGKDIPERIQNFLKYRADGIYWYDSNNNENV